MRGLLINANKEIVNFFNIIKLNSLFKIQGKEVTHN